MTEDQERIDLDGRARVRHWEHLHAQREPEATSWWQPRPELSLELIERAAAPFEARIVDVGGGASTLVDHLLDAGYQNITVVDLSESALERARVRLGTRGDDVRWLVGDVLDLVDTGPFDLWHDRAVFHFFVDENDQARYREVMTGAVAPGGHAVIATFGPTAPEYCSGLPVRRYSIEELMGFFGNQFEPISSTRDIHETPAGVPQEFVAVLLRRN